MENEKNNGKSEKKQWIEGYEQSGPSPPNGRKGQPLKVKIKFVELSDDENEERLNKIAEVLMDSALRELNGYQVTNGSLTRKETKLQ